jgi:cytochrome c oxidase subunit 2
MEPWYLRRQIDAFAAGRRGVHPDDAAGHEMQPVAARLQNSGQLDQVVTYVGQFASKPPAVTITGDLDRGKMLYSACAACHGERAEGTAALNAPALSGRTDWYMVTQLKNFAAGVRGGDELDSPAAQMRAAALALPDTSAINDVVAYINTLR